MLPKIKNFIKNNPKEVKIGIFIILILIFLVIFYKSLFYSTSEKATYGTRLRNIKDHEFVKKEEKSVINKASEIEGINKVKIEVKGRLIKVFVVYKEGISTDDIKSKFNEIVGLISDDVKSYYDITLYSEQIIDGTTKYPVIGYKLKGKENISFDVL